MRPLLTLRTASLALLLAAGSARAQTADAGATDAGAATAPRLRTLPASLRPRVEAKLTPLAGLVTGDTLTLSIKVVGKTGIDVAVPEQSFAPFELIDRKAHSEVKSGEQQLDFQLTFLALESGTHTLPGVTLRVVGPSGELGDVQTEPHTITIASLLANEPNAEPKPETKPVVVMEDDYTLAWVLGGLLAAALLVGATLLISRWHKRRPKAPPPPARVRPPWEIAVEKLLLLEREKDALFEANRGGEFIAQVGDTLREYLGRRYGFDGLESTTDEVMRTLERVRPHQLSLSGVSLLLDQCDLVKFARAVPEAEICDDLWNGAMGLIRATTPPSTSDDLPSQLPGREL